MMQLSPQFEDFRMHFVRRETNKVAHLCAQQYTSLSPARQFGVFPVFLTTVVQSEILLSDET
jgi:hypothetical protein